MKKITANQGIFLMQFSNLEIGQLTINGNEFTPSSSEAKEQHTNTKLDFFLAELIKQGLALNAYISTRWKPCLVINLSNGMDVRRYLPEDFKIKKEKLG